MGLLSQRQKIFVLSVGVGKNVALATHSCLRMPMPIVRELAHNGLRLYQLSQTPLPQLVLVCHGGDGKSKTMARRDLSFYTSEDNGALVGADVIVCRRTLVGR